MATPTLVKMGLVGRPHGIKGELGVDWYGEYLPAPGSQVYIGDGTPVPHTVASARMHGGRLLLTLQNCHDRNQADAFKGSSLFIARSDLPPSEPDEAFLADLLGAEIQLENGEHIGQLDHVEFPAGKMLWAIRGDDGREILMPAEPEFIGNIDPVRKLVTIAPPPGLLEIYRA